jgi:hypothetical protein
VRTDCSVARSSPHLSRVACRVGEDILSSPQIRVGGLLCMKMISLMLLCQLPSLCAKGLFDLCL